MEVNQVLRVSVRVAGSFVDERFVARMTRDGRLTIPILTLKLLREGEEESLEGCVLEVTVEPADERVKSRSLKAPCQHKPRTVKTRARERPEEGVLSIGSS
jgi:hypothetical protein